MSSFRSVLRVLFAIVVWCVALFPAVASFMTILPPDPFTQLLLLVPGVVVAIVGGIIFVARSGSLRQLGRFAIAVFALFVVVAIPVDAVFGVFGAPGLLQDVGTALITICVSYAGGYYLVYENGYQRLEGLW